MDCTSKSRQFWGGQLTLGWALQNWSHWAWSSHNFQSSWKFTVPVDFSRILASHRKVHVFEKKVLEILIDPHSQTAESQTSHVGSITKVHGTKDSWTQCRAVQLQLYWLQAVVWFMHQLTWFSNCWHREAIAPMGGRWKKSHHFYSLSFLMVIFSVLWTPEQSLETADLSVLAVQLYFKWPLRWTYVILVQMKSYLEWWQQPLSFGMSECNPQSLQKG